MAYLYQGNKTPIYESSALPSGTRGTAVISGGSASTKGSYVELVSSTTFTYEGFHLGVQLAAGGATYIDIAIGSATNEEIIITDLYIGYTSSVSLTQSIYIPLRVAQGTRISARIETINATATRWLKTTGISKGFGYMPVFSSSVTLGQVSGTLGTTITTTTANVKGAWVSVATIPSGDIDNVRGFMLSIGSVGDTTDSTVQYSFDIAIGTASNEELIIADFTTSATSTEFLSPILTPLYHHNINTAVFVRMQSNTASNTRDVIFYGFI